MDAHARLDVFSELAEWYERQGQASMRDRFLVLAADAALAAGLPAEAERLRQRLLQVNPHHLLKPYSSFAQAMEAPDMQAYVSDLRQNYPLETAESLLQTLRENGRPAPAAPKAPGQREEQPQVFSVRQDEAPASPRPAPRRDTPAGRRPSSAIPLPRPEAPPPRQPPAAPTVPLARPAAAPSPPAAPLPAEQASTGGAWVGSVLFGVLLLGGVAFTVWALARPLLPAGWLP
jgi:hypothetical protein